jgi:hypothetical protein
MQMFVYNTARYVTVFSITGTYFRDDPFESQARGGPYTD